MQVLNCKMKVVLIAILLASAVYSDEDISCKTGIIYTSDNGDSAMSVEEVPVIVCSDPYASPDHCYTFSGSFEVNGFKCELVVQT